MMASRPPSISFTKEATNYARLCRLLIGVGSQVLREKFNGIHDPANLHVILHSCMPNLESLRSRGILSQAQLDSMNPAVHATVSSENFDISTLCVLLMNICNLSPPETGWRRLPAPTDYSLGADIIRMRHFRNSLYAHVTKASIDETSFNSSWSDIREVLVRLGGARYDEVIRKMKTECMDPDTEKGYKSLLKEWKKQDDDIRDRLNSIDEKTETTNELLRDLKDHVVSLGGIPGIPSSPGGLPRNLPYLTAHFVGRDVDVNEILTKLQTFRMVVLLSIPGMGKTEVGIRVSHLLKQRGDQFVTHIRVESHHQKLEDICSEILDRLSSRTFSETANFKSLAKRKLSERNIPTVIVLDNTENIQGEEFDEFAQWLVKSAPIVKLVVTTRRHVGFVPPDVCKFPLAPLDPDSSAKLLRSLVDDCSEEHSKELAKLCGGIPLLLVTCSDLLNNGFSRELLIQQLVNNAIKLFRISAKDVYNTLEVFFDNFSDEVKENLVLFSVFPSEFTAQDIQFLFEDPLLCENVKTRMVKYALLQRDADGKMRMHPLVQAYFRTENESLGKGDLWRATQRKFNHHYLDQLRVLGKDFICKDSALVAIRKFRLRKANVMEALKNCLEDSSDLDDKNFVLDVVNSTEVLDFVAKVLIPPKECTVLYQKCCDIAEASGDKKRHAESLNSLGFRRLCDVSHSKDSPEENQVTLAKFQEAYEMRRTLPEEEKESQTHAHTASKLGVCFVLQGEEKKGRELIREGISIRNSLSNCLYVAAGYCDLGISYRLSGDHQKAIAIWKENTISVYEEQLGDHPWTASILSYIADSYKSLAAKGYERDYIDQAERYFRKAQELRKRLLGHHQDTARSGVQLSDILVLQGRFDEALEELEEALVIQKDILGPDHKITKNTVSKRSDVMGKRGSNPR